MRVISPHETASPGKAPYLLVCILALTFFVMLLLLVTYIPEVSVWDASVSQWVQHQRSPRLDSAMLAVTLSSDVVVALCIAGVILAYFLKAGRWWLFLHLLCVCLSAIWAVFTLKSITARTRPGDFSLHLDSFSFPSGHACTATVMCGVVALVIAQGQTRKTRHSIYAVAILIVVLIGLSRIYLQVHWPTDVVGGWLLGVTLIGAFAWQLHNSDVIASPRFSAFLLCGWVASVGVYWWLIWVNAASLYRIFPRWPSLNLTPKKPPLTPPSP